MWDLGGPTTDGFGTGNGLLEEISLGAASQQIVQSPFYITPFTPPADEVRTALIKKNQEIISRNRDIATQLRTISGNEGDREIEEAFIGNYYRVVANIHCGGGITVLRLACYLAGWKTGAAICLSGEKFIKQFYEEAAVDILDLYEHWLRPEQISYDCAKLVLSRTSTVKQQVFKIGSAAARVLTTFFEHNALLSLAFSFMGNFFKTSTSVWLSIYSGNSLDKILTDDIPVMNDAIGNVAINLAKSACEKSVSATDIKMRRPTVPATRRKVGSIIPQAPPAEDIDMDLATGPTEPVASPKSTSDIKSVGCPVDQEVDWTV